MRPVATSLLMVAIVLAWLVGLRLMPLSALPQVDYPTISVSASLPGASPETMASSVATPLERRLGTIAGVYLAGFAARVAIIVWHLIPKPGMGT